MHIANMMDDIMRPPPPGPPADPVPELQPYVYYLMLGPATVKIGYTTNLVQRMSQLRTDVQYVVAIEEGGRDRELQRHRQFAAERLGRREDFTLSDRLKHHIETLQPERDMLVAQAASCPLKQAVPQS